MSQYPNIQPLELIAHLESVVCSTDGPTIEAWPAKPDGDTSEDLLTLVNVDSFGVHCCCHRATYTYWTHLRGLGHK